jgi:hypothetical protein
MLIFTFCDCEETIYQHLFCKSRFDSVKLFFELHVYTPLYLDWEEEEVEGRLRPAFTVKTSGRPNWQTTRNLTRK